MADQSESQQAGAFEVRALEGVGSLVQAGDKFDLVGRALPFRGLSFEVVQRIQTTWYPGNPTATQQVMGATESNTTITGRWSDRYIGDKSDPTYTALIKAQGTAFQPTGDGQAAQLARNFELLCRYGVPVEVRWGTGFVNGNLTGIVTVRRGLVKRIKVTPDRAQDLNWEIEFEWRGTDDTASKAVAVNLTDARSQLNDVAAQFQDASDQIKELQDNERGLLFGAPQAFSDAMENLTTTLDDVNQAIAEQVAGVVGGLHADGGLLDNGNASYAVALMTNSVQTISLGIQQIEALPLYALSVRDDALDLLSLTADLLGLKQGLVASQATACAARDDLAGQLYQDHQAEVFAPAGTDLRDLALKYLGDPDLWYAIARYNNLSSSKVPAQPDGPSDTPGRAIKIPKTTGTSGTVGTAC